MTNEPKIGAFDAKTHLSALLDRVDAGEEITIPRRGRRGARLVPVDRSNDQDIQDAVAGLKRLRRARRLDGEDWKRLRDSGRR
jgi:prevent-host-death family protein